MRAVDIIGLSCRLPGAACFDEFWNLLEPQREAIRLVSGERWGSRKSGASSDAAVEDWGGLLDDVDRFDNEFFGISAREAQSMDPQQRLLLEETWRCLEDAGVAHDELRSRVTAVYASAMTIDYHQNVSAPGAPVDSYACLGNFIGILANRLSHVFGWRGESYALDAACAGSLTALHQARRALLAGECDYALVAGVSLIINPWHYDSFRKSRMLSPNGRCRTFDRAADGYVPGEGVVAALLCRPDDAARIGSRIHGRILGTAVGHVGRSRSITAPSVAAQRRVIEAAAAAAGVGLDTVSYVEAHGTGTPLGDPVEIAALSAAFSAAGPRAAPCLVGSAKTNIGHLEAAAGLAGLAKVLLMMRRRRIAPMLRLDAVNPLIDFENGPLRPATQAAPWRGDILRAGVSAFGFGGATAHAIVEAPPPVAAAPCGASRFPFMLSAASPAGFGALWESWRAFVATEAFAQAALPDILGTLACGRAPLAFRFAAAVSDKTQLAEIFAGPAPEPQRIGAAPRALAMLGRNRDLGLARLALLGALGWRALVVDDDGAPADAALAPWPRYHRQSGRLRLPWALDADYLTQIAAGLVLPDPAKYERLMRHARELYEGNYAFRAGLDDWRKSVDGDIPAWLDAPPRRDDDKRVLLLCVAAALRRLLDRWGLPQTCDPPGEAWDELAALVADGLLTDREAVALLGPASGPPSGLAERLCQRALADGRAPDYPILRRESARRAGEILLDAQPSGLDLRLDEDDEQELLARLWRAGAAFDWRALGERFRVVSLPLYPFRGERRWIDLAPPAAANGEAPAAENIDAALDCYAANALFVALDRAGALTPLGSGYSREETASRCQSSAHFDAFLGGALDLLAQHGLVAHDGAQARAKSTRWEAAQAAAELRPRLAAAGDVDALMAGLPELLKGAATAESLGALDRLRRMCAKTGADGPFAATLGLLADAQAGATEEDRADAAPQPSAPPVPAIPAHEPSYAELAEQVRSLVARVAQCDPASVGDDRRLSDIGVDSLASGDLAQLLSEAFGRRIAPHVVDDHPTVERLVAYLAYGAATTAAAPPPKSAPKSFGSTTEWRLAAPGDLASLAPVETSRRALQPDEIEVEVVAAGLNFRDVMEGLGRLGGAPRPLGLEFSGRIRRLGAGETEFEVGAEVVGVTVGALARHVVARRSLLARKPSALSFAEAAALPIVFLTAVWVLEDFAQLRGGQTVLIHAGAGGVGLAAIQAVRALGGTVLATAGSDEKRAFLRDLGVACIGDSRSLAFVEDVRRATRGAGVDVLLNCLAGPLTDAGLDLVAPGGAFIELGKTDIRPADAIARSHPGIRYRVFDLLTEIDERPEVVGARLRQILQRFERGQFAPPPLTAFAFGEASEALRSLARASHIGKVVLTDAPAPRPATKPAPARAPSAAPAKTISAKSTNDGIAVIAMSGRFPGAPDIDALWRLLREGGDAVESAPEGRWRDEEFAALGADADDAGRLRAGGHLDDADCFDAAFFGLSPREALAMDPQQRLLLEEAWLALAAAGVAPRSEADARVGVFVGASASDYGLKCALLHLPQDAPTLLGQMPSSLAARISYAFDFAGPALTVDTGCTSSATALKLGMEALERGEIDLAVVGAVALQCTPQLAVQAAQADILAADGRCRAFSGDGAGIGLSEGVGVVVLKRLAEALAPPDRVLAVLRAVGVRQNGATRGLGSPSVAAQTALARETLARAGVDPTAVSYIEAHGVGTSSGDGAEASALAAVFGAGAPLAVGSVKSNIGHTLASAGMAGLFKAALQLRHRLLAPSLHGPASAPPEFAGSRLALNKRLTPWAAAPGAARIAAVNVFGVNGGNGFMVIEEAPAVAAQTVAAPREGLLLLTAAASQAQLQARLAALAAWLEDETPDLADIACSLHAELAALPQTARKFRAAFVASSSSDLRTQLLQAAAQAQLREARRHDADMQQIFAAAAAHFIRDAAAEGKSKLEAAGKLFVDGANFSPPPVAGARRLSYLPGYPFERRRFWPGAAPSDATPGAPHAAATQAADSLSLLRAAVAETLGLPVSAVDAGATLPSLGLDSLLALDLRRRLTRSLGAAPDLAALLSRTPIAALAPSLQQSPRTASTPAPVAADPSAALEPFPLTDIQMAYWLGRSGAYALGGACQLYWEFVGSPDRDPARLETALNRLIAQHDMLRAVVNPDGTQQALAAVPHYTIERRDFRGEAAGLAALRAEMEQDVFDPARWPLFRVAFSRGDVESRLHLSIDLLVVDVPSLALLIGQWARLERAPDAALTAPAICFRDYVLHRRSAEASAEYRQARDYWAKEVAALPPAPRLKGMRPLDALPPRWRRWRSTLEKERSSALERRAGAQGATLVAALATALAEVLARCAEERRFTLNFTVNDRDASHADITQVVGDFTSTVLLGLDLDDDAPFAARLAATSERLARHLTHARFSGVKALQLRGLRGGDAIMPVVFTSMLGHARVSGPLGRLDYGVTRTPQVWLDIQVMEDDDGLVLTFDAVEGVLPGAMLEALLADWRAALAFLADDDAAWSRPLGVWLAEREHAQRKRRNATRGPLPEGLLHEPFVQQALAAPERIAVIAGEQTITYGQLLAQAQAAAAALGPITPDRLVAVGMRKGWLQIAAVFGVLIAGGAYLPIDPALPEARRRRLLDRGEAVAVMTSSDLASLWPQTIRAIAIDALDPAAPTQPSAPSARPDDLAYVIFTSGSTGEPKGVMIEHRSALNTICDLNERFGVGAQDRILALSDLAFDLSVYDIFGVLGAGGALVLPDGRSTQDPDYLARLVSSHRVTLWNTVPSFMQLFMTSPLAPAALQRLRLVLMSGDWIARDLPPRLQAAHPGLAVVSLGGATEASIWSILHPIGPPDAAWDSIPYGTPMRNQRFHVFDADFNDCPDWVTGELYIAGEGLARGYWRDDAKTAERFVQHPRSGERLYRTGDLGRYRDGGLIEFLGRADGQVKIGGYRVEIGEIEAALTRHPAIAQAVVVARADDAGRKILAAAYVLRTGATADAQTLRAFLAQTLPAYMTPAVFERRDALPHNANDKIDRQALARAAAPEPRRETPQGVSAEERLLVIWREVLGNPQLGPDDKVFEHGAHSFHAVDANLRINRELGLTCTVTDIFEFPSVRALAAALTDRGEQRNATPPVAEFAAVNAAARSDRRRQFRAASWQ